VLPACLGASLQAQVPMGLLISQQSRTAFTVQGAGARAEGIGGAFTAVADDATAVSFNPAGLGQLVQPEISLVGTSYRRSFENRGFISFDQIPPLGLSDSTARDQRSLPTFASATLPTKFLGKNLVFQLSWQRLFDLSVETGKDVKETDPSGALPSKYLQQHIHQSGQVSVWSAAVAYDFSPRFLVGFSWNLWRGSWDFHSNSDESLLPLPNPQAESTLLRERDGLRGSNWTLGVLWRSEWVNVGAVYRSPFTARFESRMEATTNVQPNGLTPEFSARYEVDWPETFGAGLACRPRQQWLLALDWTRTRWSRATFRPNGGSLDGLNFFDLRAGGETRTPDAESLRFGTEYLLFTRDSVLPLRAGLFREPQPTADPVSGDRRILRGFTLGLGWKVRSLSLDVAYKYSRGSRRASQFLEADEIASGRNLPTSRGEEVIREHRIFLSLNYRFANEGVGRFLRWFFVQGR
jgi:long-subunit fatty acid transport protein